MHVSERKAPVFETKMNRKAYLEATNTILDTLKLRRCHLSLTCLGDRYYIYSPDPIVQEKLQGCWGADKFRVNILTLTLLRKNAKKKQGTA